MRNFVGGTWKIRGIFADTRQSQEKLKIKNTHQKITMTDNASNQNSKYYRRRLYLVSKNLIDDYFLHDEGVDE